MQYFKTVLPKLAEKQPTSLFYETRANLSREQVRLLATARINGIQPGIESLSNKSLRLMQKGCSKEQNVQLLKWCSEYGVRVAWNYLIGFPGEDEKEFDVITDEVEMLHHLEPPHGFGVLRVDRFSPYFNDPEKYGLSPITPAAAYRYVYPLADEAIGHIAYFYESQLLADKEKGRGVGIIDSMVSRWHEAYSRSFLLEVSRGDTLILIDTRKCRRHWIHRLKGLRRAIYRHCDSAHSLDNIVRALSDQATADEVVAAIESLVSSRLLLYTERRYVSLGVTPDRRLTFKIAAALETAQQQSGRCHRLAHDLGQLARMLLQPRKIAARAYYRLRNAWRRRRIQLIRRAVLWTANRYSDTAIKNI